MQIELTVDQVDEVLIDELKRAYTDHIASPKQLKAIRRVLKYYMVPADYDAFIESTTATSF